MKKLICRPMNFLDNSARKHVPGYKEYVLSQCVHYNEHQWCMEMGLFMELRNKWKAEKPTSFPEVGNLPKEYIRPGYEQVMQGFRIPDHMAAFNNQPAPKSKSSPWDFGPGSVLKAAIKAATGEVPSPNCACTARARQMNAWGWTGCIRNRKTILKWLTEEAAKRGHKVGTWQALGLLRAAWKEVKKSDLPDEEAAMNLSPEDAENAPPIGDHRPLPMPGHLQPHPLGLPGQHQPGRMLRFAIYRVTGAPPSPDNNHTAWEQQMNAWGPEGCWEHREQIAQWLVQAAEQHERSLDAATALKLVEPFLRRTLAIQPAHQQEGIETAMLSPAARQQPPRISQGSRRTAIGFAGRRMATASNSR